MSLQEIADHIDQMTVSLDDTFQFHCTQCGKCCIHREDILLSPYDLYKIARELQMEPIEVCKRYCETYIGNHSRMPIVRLMPQGAVQRCPFLKNQKCSIQLNQFSETELREIRERAEKIYMRNPINAAIQMVNTGNDSPPGVRDWYVFSKFYDGINAQFECQRQNTWWNSKMVTVRIITAVFMLILVGSIFLFLLLNNSILNVLLCSAGILIKICERVIENWRYFRVSRLIDGSQQIIEVHPTAEGIEKLQNLIDNRRSINVLELGWLHNKLANKFSKVYENIVS